MSKLTTNVNLALQNNQFNLFQLQNMLCLGTINQVGCKVLTSINQLNSMQSNTAITNGITSTLTSMDKSDITSVLSAMASNADITPNNNILAGVIAVLIVIVVMVGIVSIAKITAKPFRQTIT